MQAPKGLGSDLFGPLGIAGDTVDEPRQAAVTGGKERVEVLAGPIRHGHRGGRSPGLVTRWLNDAHGGNVTIGGVRRGRLGKH
jgi:hypothetical protein